MGLQALPLLQLLLLPQPLLHAPALAGSHPGNLSGPLADLCCCGCCCCGRSATFSGSRIPHRAFLRLLRLQLHHLLRRLLCLLLRLLQCLLLHLPLRLQLRCT